MAASTAPTRTTPETAPERAAGRETPGGPPRTGPHASRATGRASVDRWLFVAAALAGLLPVVAAGIAVWGATVDWGALVASVRAAVPGPEAVRAYLEGFGAWAPLALFLTQAAQVVVAIIPSGPVTFAGVAAVGPWWGFALSVAGGTAGSVAAFALARRFGRPMVAKLAGRGALDRYSDAVGDDGRWLLLAFQIPIPVGGDALCALAGLTRMPLGRFVLVSAAGRAPWTAFNVLVAAGLVTGSAGPMLAVGLLAVASAVLTAKYARHAERWLLRRRAPSAGGTPERHEGPDGARSGA